MDTSLLTLSDQQTIAQQVFDTMAGIDISACDASPFEANDISSMLTFSEGAMGAVLIDCNRDLAYAFTARLMSIDLPTSDDEDVLDAMGELVNMIGGNLKGLLPANTCISTPIVLSSREREEILAKMEQVSRSCFSSAEGHFRISLLKPVMQYSML